VRSTNRQSFSLDDITLEVSDDWLWLAYKANHGFDEVCIAGIASHRYNAGSQYIVGAFRRFIYYGRNPHRHPLVFANYCKIREINAPTE
jgi:hypothetical protein